MPDRSALPPTFDHLAKKKPLTTRVVVYLDDEPVEALKAAREALEHTRAAASRDRAFAIAKGGATTDGLAALDAATSEVLEPLEKAVEAAEKNARAASVELVFRSIGRVAYDRLVREHPATDEDDERTKKENLPPIPYHVESFAPALIAASCVQPKMTVDQVNQLFEEWNDVELAELFTAAFSANNGRRVADLGKGRG